MFSAEDLPSVLSRILPDPRTVKRARIQVLKRLRILSLRVNHVPSEVMHNQVPHAAVRKHHRRNPAKHHLLQV